MKNKLTAIWALSFCLCTYAQNKSPRQVDIQSRFIEAKKNYLQQLGVDFALPAGDFNKDYSFGLGVNYTGNLLLDKRFSISGDASYKYFFGKEITVVGGNATMPVTERVKAPAENEISILAGPRAIVLPNTGVSIKAGLSVPIIKNNAESSFAWSASIDHIFDTPAPGDIPLLKKFFLGAGLRYGSSGSSGEKTELLIFITPRIISERD